jgi:Uma2 family endonuclease
MTSSMTLTLVRHRFTVDEYEQMVSHGILTENDRVELIRGEIIDKITVGPGHGACVKKLNRLFGSLVDSRAIVSIQDPIRLRDSEPEPDVALLVLREDFYGTHNPTPADVLLVIEVSDTTLEYDRTVKRPLYAESGIVEYWIVNLEEECVEVHRQPAPDGAYADVTRFRRGDRLEVSALPGCTFLVDLILG